MTPEDAAPARRPAPTATSAGTLERFLAPQSVAVVGASPDRGKITGILFYQVTAGGYGGPLYPVNPGYAEIGGRKCYPSLAAIGAPVDLAVIAIPTERVLPVLEEGAAAGLRHAVILTSGFAEQGGATAALQEQIAAFARRTGTRVCGPNCIGFYSAGTRLAATFSPAVEPKPGRDDVPASPRRVGVVSQSGGMAFTFYDYGRPLGLGFSHIISTGNEVDLTLSDFFAHLVEDDATQVILLFIEGIRDPARFTAAAEAAARKGKPVVVCKIGRSQAAARAAVSHTANMAGWDAAYDAVFRKYGMTVARDPEEMATLAAAFATCPPARGRRVGVITVSGGGGALAADALAAEGLVVPELSRRVQEEIAAVIPSYGSAANPIDVTAQGHFSGGLASAVRFLDASDEVDAMLVVGSLASETRVSVDVEAIRPTVAAQQKPLLVYSYTRPSLLGRRTLAEAGVVMSLHLTWSARALRALAERGAFRPPAPAALPAAADFPTIAASLARDGSFAEFEAKALLAGFGVAMAPHSLARERQDAIAAASRLGFPVALKVQSRDIPHKTELGGVRLGLADAAAVGAAWDGMMARARAAKPEAAIDGVLVESMAPRGVEIIIGVLRDPVFGPVLMVGAGGVDAELYGDASYRPAPVDAAEARTMVEELRAAKRLAGWRGAPPYDIDALSALIAQVSVFAAVFADRVAELELNPVLVHEKGCTVADALMRTQAREEGRDR